MKISHILLTYQRPNILQTAINTLLSNAVIKPDELWILDDGSDFQLKQALLNGSKEITETICPTNVIFAGKNRGIGYNFEMAYNLMRQSDSDVVCFIESDYIWRKGWLEDCLAVFEASPHTIAIAGTNHMDMYDASKTGNTFPDLMIKQFGKDLNQREHLYKDFSLETSRGKIQVRGVSNSCGCMIVHWGRLRNLLMVGDINHDLTEFSTSNYWTWMDRAFNKNGTGNRKDASDGHMSQTLAFFAERYMEFRGVDITKNFGILSISDFNISQHICGKGRGAPHLQEGETFNLSINWNPEYLEKGPR